MYKEIEGIYDNKNVLKIYINGNTEALDNKYVLGLELNCNLFDTEVSLGSTPSVGAKLKLHNDVIEETVETVYIESGLEDDLIPMGHFYVDDFDKTDFTTEFTLYDSMMKLDKNYDGSTIMESGYATLLQVWNDICNKFSIESAIDTFNGANQIVAVYDNQVTARTYIGYIAEQAGGFAIFDRNGKLTIRQLGTDRAIYPKKYLKQGFNFGNSLRYSKVKYEDGIQDFEDGNDDYNTLWISQDNMYIVSQSQIDTIYSIYNQYVLNGFTGEGQITPAIDWGDVLIIDEKPLLFQGTLKYQGKWIGNISSDIQSKEQEDTTNRNVSQQTINRRVQSSINQTEGTITQLVEETIETKTSVSEINQTMDDLTTKVAYSDDVNSQFTEINQKIDNITINTSNAGGDNIFFYDSKYWYGEKAEETTTDADLQESTATPIIEGSLSGYGYLIGNGDSKQSNVVKNGDYVVSLLYYRIKDDASLTLTINEDEYALECTDTENWHEYSTIVNIDTGKMEIGIKSDTEEAFYVADLMVSYGNEKVTWSQNPNETRTETVTIGKGIKVESSETNTYTTINSDGNRTFNKTTNEVVAEMTDKGLKSYQIEVESHAKINKLFIQKVGNQVWLTGIGG